MTSSSESQKRSDFRTEISYPIWYRDFAEADESREWTRAVTRDLSGGGASFRLRRGITERMEPDNLLEVQIIIPPTPIFAIGRIVRVFHDEKGRRCAGVMFASIDDRDKDRIVRAVLSEGVGKP